VTPNGCDGWKRNSPHSPANSATSLLQLGGTVLLDPETKLATQVETDKVTAEEDVAAAGAEDVEEVDAVEVVAWLVRWMIRRHKSHGNARMRTRLHERIIAAKTRGERRWPEPASRGSRWS
jgi:hypothetical protein